VDRVSRNYLLSQRKKERMLFLTEKAGWRASLRRGVTLGKQLFPSPLHPSNPALPPPYSTGLIRRNLKE
jgi:hypothetical protein